MYIYTCIAINIRYVTEIHSTVTFVWGPEMSICGNLIFDHLA